MTSVRQANNASWRVVGAMRTDVGRVRSLNEDTVVFVAPPEQDPHAKFGLLALVAEVFLFAALKMRLKMATRRRVARERGRPRHRSGRAHSEPDVHHHCSHP